jgi:predicted RNase H-like HicB family nuclease
MKFTVYLEKDPEEGGYVISCPAIKGCHSQGETMDEALANIKEAIIGCLRSLNDRAKKAANPQKKPHVVIREVRVA